jgi:sirohydrochlorin ferrochelatase
LGGGQSQRETSPSEHLASAARAIVRAEGLAAELAADISARAPSAESSGSQVHPRQRNRIRRDGKATVAVLQALLSENPTAAFARADIDGSGDLTFDEWHLACGGEEGVEADVLRALFDEFDADQNGCVSLAEFQAGLKTVRPLATGLDEMKDLVRGIGLEDLFASHLALMLQERRPAGEKELPIDLAAIATHLNPGDMQAAWQMGLSDEVAHAFRKQLRLLQRGGGTMDAAQMNAKFAGSTFEGAYENLEEYLAGIEKHIGLAAVNMYEGSLGVAALHQLSCACSWLPLGKVGRKS